MVICELVNQFNWDPIFSDNIELSWKLWRNHFLSIMAQLIPNRVILTRRNLPWLNKSIIQSMKKQNHGSCLKRARGQGTFVSSSLLAIAHLHNYDRLRGGISTLWILSNQRSFGKPSSSWIKASNQSLLCLWIVLNESHVQALQASF